MSHNRAILLGSVGQDPEVRTGQNGKRWASFSLATSESWTDTATGEKKESTDWHRITVFNDGLCGVIEKYVKKGSKVLIEGKIKTRKYTDNAGVEKYSTEIVLTQFDGKLSLEGSPQGARRDEGDYGTSSTRAQQPAARSGNFPRDLDDEVPF